MHNVCTFKSHHENISIFLFREDYVGVNNFYSCDDNSTQTYLTISDIDVLAQIDVKSLNDPNKLMRDLFIEKITKDESSIQQYTGIPLKKIFAGAFG